MRMRTIDEAIKYVLEHDPETALTKTALRRLVVTGVIPSVRIGTKYLVGLENLELYLSGGLPTTNNSEQPPSGVIRRIEL